MDPAIAFRLFLLFTTLVACAMFWRAIKILVAEYRRKQALKALSAMDLDEINKFEQYLRSDRSTPEAQAASYERIYGEKP